MKRIIKVSACEFKLTRPSASYIYKYHEYDLECKIMSRDYGLLTDKYVLELKGNGEDIQVFLDYLKCSGFKIH